MTTSPDRADERARATWAVARTQLDRFHITRVADVTALDSLGVPTWMAVRPDSHTLSVSQGKGTSRDTARISAVMECIEAWHCERVAEVLPWRYDTGADLGVRYHLDDLPGFRSTGPGSQGAHRWAPATGLVTHKPTWVPLDYLDLSLSAQRRPDRSFTASTNGLAAGIDVDSVVRTHSTRLSRGTRCRCWRSCRRRGVPCSISRACRLPSPRW